MTRLLIIVIIILLGLFFMPVNVKLSLSKKKKYYIVIISTILILQSGLRHIYVGPDTYQYYKHFELAKLMSWDEVLYNFINSKGKDPFYYVFQKIFQILFTDYQIYLIFVAFLFFTTLGYFIYKNTYSLLQILLAYVLYICNFYIFFSITGIRQTLATSFILLSIEFIKKRRLFIFLGLVSFASLLHISALVFIVAYPLVNFINVKRIYLASLILFIITFIFKSEVSTSLVEFTDTGDRFGEYLDNQYSGGSVILTISNYVLGILGLIQLKKVINNYKKSNLIFTIFGISLIFFPLQWVNPNAMRISQYFNISMLVLIPLILSSITNVKEKKFGIFIFSILFFIVMMLFSINKDGEYRFFWQIMELPDNYK